MRCFSEVVGGWGIPFWSLFWRKNDFIGKKRARREDLSPGSGTSFLGRRVRRFYFFCIFAAHFKMKYYVRNFRKSTVNHCGQTQL